MKNKYAIALLASSLVLAGCAGIAAAESIKAVSEIAATNAVQKGELTVAQLSTLSTDLAALPQTPLPTSDNKLIAGIITEAINHKAATPTDAAVVDALNGVLADVQASRPPTPADGIAWSELQDAVLGFKKSVVLAGTP
jgi:PBP1b-binding outer membrane lipoprotein LpoB